MGDAEGDNATLLRPVRGDPGGRRHQGQDHRPFQGLWLRNLQGRRVCSASLPRSIAGDRRKEGKLQPRLSWGLDPQPISPTHSPARIQALQSPLHSLSCPLNAHGSDVLPSTRALLPTFLSLRVLRWIFSGERVPHELLWSLRRRAQPVLPLLCCRSGGAGYLPQFLPLLPTDAAIPLLAPEFWRRNPLHAGNRGFHCSCLSGAAGVTPPIGAAPSQFPGINADQKPLS